MNPGQTDRRPFLPDFCEQGNLLRTMLIAELLVFVLVAAIPGGWLERLVALGSMSVFVQWIAVVDIALLCALQDRLGRLDDRLAAVLAFVLLQAVTLGFTVIGHAIVAWLGLPPGQQPLHRLLLENGVISVIVTAVALHYLYVSARWQREIEATAQARVQALQARIRPHFLFNSMNTIASLTRTAPETAERAVEDLSELFRASLTERGFLTLAEELELVASYLRLERERLGERLEVEWDTDPAAGEAAMPALSLQPLAENAVYHGVAQLPEGGRIRVETRREGHSVRIALSNPLPADPAPIRGHRIARDNVRQRLALAYGDAAALEVDSTGRDYRVTLWIPLPEESS